MRKAVAVLLLCDHVWDVEKELARSRDGRCPEDLMLMNNVRTDARGERGTVGRLKPGLRDGGCEGP